MYSYEKISLGYNEAKEKALKYLEYRSHSEKELSDKLKQKGASDQVICEVIEFLHEYKLVDDLEFAKKYAHDLVNLKKLGKSRIKTELFKKGINQEIINSVLYELPEEDEDVLFELVKKRIRGNLEKKNFDKVMRYFIYKGYSPDKIKECIKRCEGENDGI